MSMIPSFRVLIADVDDSLLDRFATILQSANIKQNYSLELCTSANRAVHAVRSATKGRDPFALVIIDVEMAKGMEGLDAVEQIRANDPDVNFVLMSSAINLNLEEISERVIPTDKFLYCQKPVHAIELEQLAHAMTSKWATERDLEKARRDAEIASRAKSEFLANMGHELRTPLNAIIGFSELMESEVLGPIGHERYLNYTKDIRSSGAHLLGVINDILDITKIEAGRFQLREARVVVADLVDAACREFDSAGQDDNLIVRSEVPANLPMLSADQMAIEKILRCLISNAIKFSPGGGEITLRSGIRADGQLWIGVEDQGIGMTQEEIEKALVYFGQVDGAISRKFDGLGLGLTLAMALTEQHGARLSIESREGIGTTVTVIFPAHRVRLAG